MYFNFSQNYGIVLADIIVNLLCLQFWKHSRYFLITFKRYACNIHVMSLLHFQYFQIIFPRYFQKYAEVYLQDVVSTSEARSWFKLDRGNFFWAFLWKFSVPIRKIHGNAYRNNFDIIFGLLSLIYWVLYYLFLYPYESLWNIKVLGKKLKFFYGISLGLI